jgi:energy-converting hydrogenase Eha subunit H
VCHAGAAAATPRASSSPRSRSSSSQVIRSPLVRYRQLAALCIEYRIDAVNAFVLVLLGLVATVVSAYARTSVAAEVPREQHYLFYAMYCLTLAGLSGITVTGDAFNLFVFLEISSLSSYVLIALGRDRRALYAAYQYLIMGTIGATFIVIGVGLLYLKTGTLNLADLAERIGTVEQARPILAALAFLTVGISLKLALFPLHMWLPNAYAFAPSAVSAMVAATGTKVSVYVLLRFYFSVFGASAVFGALPIGHPVVPDRRDAHRLAAAEFQRSLPPARLSSVGRSHITPGSARHQDRPHCGHRPPVQSRITKERLPSPGLYVLAESLRLDRMAGQQMPFTCWHCDRGLEPHRHPGDSGFITKVPVPAAIEMKAWIAFVPVAACSRRGRRRFVSRTPAVGRGGRVEGSAA